jgi:hypothetical protein
LGPLCSQCVESRISAGCAPAVVRPLVRGAARANWHFARTGHYDPARLTTCNAVCRRPTEPGDGLAEWTIFASHPSVEFEAVDQIKQVRIVDFTAVRFVAAGHACDLEMFDAPDVPRDGIGKAPFRELQVIDVKMQVKVGIAYGLDRL